ncbi:ABC transporter permease [Caldisericum sp. AR60]|uniref:ABC transporter permease n=1 Tax=Caldisericum sp. AR60 TaxID=3397852 RepID=UPI0039FD446C
MLKFLRALFKLRLKLDLAFRIDIVFNFLNQLVYFIGVLLLFKAIYLNVNSIGGWDIGDMYILLGTYFILTELYSTTFRGGLLNLPETVKEGNLEVYLLKPVNTIIFLLLQKVNVGRIWRILPGLILLTYGLKIDSIHIGLNLLLYTISFVFSLLIYTLQAFCVSLLSFWFYEVNNLFYIYDDLIEFAKYPDSVYSGFIRKIFLSVIPVIVFSSFPARILTGSLDLKESFVFQIILLLVFLLTSLILWETGLKKYQGRG